jgi:hypothetical protein
MEWNSGLEWRNERNGTVEWNGGMNEMEWWSGKVALINYKQWSRVVERMK